MAGDWLKFDKATPEKPEVFAMATELGLDPDAVVGKLMRIWSWFDTHTTNGNASRVTPALLDRIAGITGFVSAMANCGWITIESDGCLLPNFDRHCGETAKGRALGAKRTAGFRARNGVGVTTASPEKRREEKKEQEQKKPQAALTVVIPEWIDPESWDGFAVMRKRERHPLTDRAAKLVISELVKLRGEGHNPNEILDASTRNGWRDVYGPKNRAGSAQNNHQRDAAAASGESLDDLMRRAI